MVKCAGELACVATSASLHSQHAELAARHSPGERPDDQRMQLASVSAAHSSTTACRATRLPEVQSLHVAPTLQLSLKGRTLADPPKRFGCA